MSDQQLALFETRDTRPSWERTEQPIHVLMPCMAFACGGSMLDRLHRGFVLGTNDELWAQVDCPACLALGRDAIREETDRQTSNQARGKT